MPLAWAGIRRSTANAMRAITAQPRISMPMNATLKRAPSITPATTGPVTAASWKAPAITAL